MRVLVTGAAGFIGARVTSQLLDEGHTVVAVDSFNSAYDPRIKEWRLCGFESQPGLTLHRADISDRRVLAEIVRGSGTEALINLAAQAGVRHSLEAPWDYYAANVSGTLNLLECCQECGIHKFVLASTSSVYGDSPVLPVREDMATDRPLSPYAASKKAAEVLAFAYHHHYGIDVSVLRYFTVYGPAGRPDMSIFRFTRWMAEGEPLLVYGDGTQRRDFTYVDDIARGTIAGLKPLGYEVINLGSGEPASLLEVIGFLEEALGKKAAISFQPPNPLDVQATWADNSKASRLLGWEPQVSLRDGLQRTVQWYREHQELALSVGL